MQNSRAARYFQITKVTIDNSFVAAIQNQSYYIAKELSTIIYNV